MLSAGSACLFPTDQKFPSLKGHVSEVIEVVPPGNYSLIVKRDYFNKVRGAVRDRTKLAQQVREYVRIDLALRAASAGWDFEVEQLQVRDYHHLFPLPLQVKHHCMK